MIAVWLVLSACAAGATTDLRTRRIPNAIPIALAICGGATAATIGWQAFLTFLAIGVAAIFFGTILHSMRLLGGGDVKLIAAAAATLGAYDLRAAGILVLATILSGGVIGVAIALFHGRLRATATNLHAMAMPFVAGGPLVAPISGGTKMPYGLAIFAGALAVVIAHFLH